MSSDVQAVGHKPSENRVKLLVMGWIRLLIEDKVNNIPIECKLICKDFFGALIASKILKTDDKIILLTYIKQQTQYDWNWKLLYRATENGFGKDSFYKHCQDKENTVVIIHNDQDDLDQVYGGYTPCPWKNNKENQIKRGKDESLTTCIFILRTKAKHGPQLLKLKKDRINTAVSYRDNTAFDFGCDDFGLSLGGIHSFSKLGECCFEWKNIKHSNIYLNGGLWVHVIPKEIEIFQLY